MPSMLDSFNAAVSALIIFFTRSLQLSSVHGDLLLRRYFSGGLGSGGEGEGGDVSAALTAVAASVLEADLPALLLHRRETSARMLQFLLSCCARPPRNLIFLTFDLWAAMHDHFFSIGERPEWPGPFCVWGGTDMCAALPLFFLQTMLRPKR